MRILAIDTSSQGGSVAVSADGGPAEIVRLHEPSSHLVDLGKAVCAALAAAGTAVEKLDRVAIVTGPGSFTGLRVGMAYVKGLYAARGLDVVAMTSLELLARQVAGGGLPVAPMIDARKNEVYAALYAASAKQEPSHPAAEALPGVVLQETVPVEKAAPCVVAPETFLSSLPRQETTFVGSGAVRYRDVVERAFGTRARFVSHNEPDTQLFCRLAGILPPLDSEDVVALEPFYVRPSDVKLKPLKGVRVYDRNRS